MSYFPQIQRQNSLGSNADKSSPTSPSSLPSQFYLPGRQRTLSIDDDSYKILT